MRKAILLLILALPAVQITAQLSFLRGNALLRPDREHRSGVAGAMADVNGDGFDDLVVLNKSKILEVGIFRGKNTPLQWSAPLEVNANEEYALTVGDIDNDHIAEIVTGGIYSGSKFFKRNTGGNYYLAQNISQPIYTQSANMVDYNNDGFLDYFACNDQGNSLLVRNNAGEMTVANIIDFSTIPPSDNSGNYGSEWSDIDNDGDMDLYIAKCKFGITDREDPRRHNMLFINEGGGSFVNQAEMRGMKNKGQSWTGSFADYDNDGDQDCLITNHDEPHALMRNDGTGHFIEHVLNVPLNASYAFQSLWADFDNNGFLDFFITGADKTFFYMNRDGEIFDKVEGVFAAVPNSAALGDINDDGFIDIAAYYGIGINLPGPIRDEIFINTGNENKFMKFALRGQMSNAMGVGAKLELYGAWGKQTREVHAGISYGVSSSLAQHFGLGNAPAADSLVVYWPSGHKDVFTQLSANATYFVQEGRCISKRIPIVQSRDLLCPGESIQLSLPSGYAAYQWSDGSAAPVLTVNEAGGYMAVATDAQGCLHFSEMASVRQFDATHLIEGAKDTVYSCELSYTQLNALSGLTDYVWSNGDTGIQTKADGEGWLGISAVHPCGFQVKDSVYVKVIVGGLEVKNDTVAVGETAVLQATGNDVEWYADPEGKEKVHTGNSLTIANVQSSMTYYARAGRTDGYAFETLGEINLPVANTYSSDNVDAGLYLNIYRETTLHHFTVQTDKAGIRRFLLIRYEGDTLLRKDVMIMAGEPQKIELNLVIPPGTYYKLKTDHLLNRELYGHDGPRLVRTGDMVQYPYNSGMYAEIPLSIKGPSAYYYFYDILLSDGGIPCYSDLKAATVIVKQPSATAETTEGLMIHPNPAHHTLTIRSDREQDFYLTDVSGKMVLKGRMQSGWQSSDVSMLAPGLYLLHAGAFKTKVMVVR